MLATQVVLSASFLPEEVLEGREVGYASLCGSDLVVRVMMAPG